MDENIHLKIKKNKGYTLIWQGVNQDIRLRNKDLGLLVRLLSLPDDWRFSEAGLIKRFGIGKHELKKELEILEQCGYLERKQKRDANGKFAGTEWIVYDEPLHHDPLPMSGFPMTDKPATENQQQLNKNLLNTKELNLSHKAKGFYCSLKKSSSSYIDEHCKNCYIINQCPFPLRKLTIAECFDPFYLNAMELDYLMKTVLFPNSYYDIQLRLENKNCTEEEKEYFKIEENNNGSV